MVSAPKYERIDDEENEGYTLASAWGVKPWDNDVVDTCAITTFPVAMGDVTAYEQTIAHEVWHCVQYYDGMNYSGGQQNRWVEGGAEFFSNVAYPSANDEWGRLSTFDAGQRSPLYEMDYEVWPWWQHLSNEFSPLFVADLHREMMQSGGSGIELFDGYDETFHDFVVDYAAGVIQDQSGVTLPPAVRYKFLPVVGKNDEGKELTFDARSWAPIRLFLQYDQELRIFQTDASGGETLTVNNLNETYNQVTTDARFGGTFSFPSAMAEGSGEYECGEDTMTLTVANYPPISWTRVDKILQPPDAPTDPGTGQAND